MKKTFAAAAAAAYVAARGGARNGRAKSLCIALRPVRRLTSSGASDLPKPPPNIPRSSSKLLLHAFGISCFLAFGTATFCLLRKDKTEKSKSAFEGSKDEQAAAIPWSPRLPTREQLIEKLATSGSKDQEADIFDVLVVGGGATGCGVALDAATRGLKVGLIERDDFAAGTSSRSTKLVHGGVRYLEKAFRELDREQLNLVIEALRERAVFLRNAPHLADSVPIMLPLYKWWQVPYYYAGCKFYDLFAGGHALQSSYFLSRTRAIEAFPMLKKDNLVGALVYYDGQHNDARMNVALALTAVLHGAAVANHTEVTKILKNEDSKIIGVECCDRIADRKFNVRARCVVNATGPFSDSIRKLDCPTTKDIVVPSAGVHIVLPKYFSPTNMGLLDPQTSDGRVIFFLPWENATIAGTTDSPTNVTSNPAPSEQDINWILSEVRRYLAPDVRVRRSDVLAAWSGIRPLVRDPDTVDKETSGGSSTAGLVRNHALHKSPSGLVTIAGGKWTTYRAMAEDTVDFAVKHFGLVPQPAKKKNVTFASAVQQEKNYQNTDKKDLGKCVTAKTPLLGARAYTPTTFVRLIQHFGLDSDVAQHLSRSYGDQAWAVAAIAQHTGRLWPAAGRRLVPGLPYIEAEVTHAVRSEYACTAVDVIARRTRLAFLNAQAAADSLPRVIAIMAKELDWDAAKCAQEHAEALAFLNTMGLLVPSAVPSPAAAAAAAAASPLAGDSPLEQRRFQSHFTKTEMDLMSKRFHEQSPGGQPVKRSRLLKMIEPMLRSQDPQRFESEETADELLAVRACELRLRLVDKRGGIDFGDFLQVATCLREYQVHREHDKAVEQEARAVADAFPKAADTKNKHRGDAGADTTGTPERSGGGV